MTEWDFTTLLFVVRDTNIRIVFEIRTKKSNYFYVKCCVVAQRLHNKNYCSV
jgi:hypothetical protein